MHITEILKTTLQNASRGLVYAEIGKSSSKHQHNQQLSNFLDFDDNRIEYAQLNHQAPTKLPVVQNKLDGMQ